jgi:hypothetical protein
MLKQGLRSFKLGGSPLKEDILDELLYWKWDTDEKNPEQ